MLIGGGGCCSKKAGEEVTEHGVCAVVSVLNVK